MQGYIRMMIVTTPCGQVESPSYITSVHSTSHEKGRVHQTRHEKEDPTRPENGRCHSSRKGSSQSTRHMKIFGSLLVTIRVVSPHVSLRNCPSVLFLICVYCLQQDFAPPVLASPSPSLFPPVLGPAPPSPSLGSFFAMARKMSLTLRAVLADVSMNKRPFSSA